MNTASIFLNSLKTLVILMISLLISIGFNALGVNEANIILIFTLGVLFTARFTDTFIYGIISSILAVCCFNFFFTTPLYSFNVNNPDYIIIFLIMLLTTLITSTLTSRVKHSAKLAQMREIRIQMLYENNKKLLLARSEAQIIDYCGESLVNILNRPVAVSLLDEADLQTTAHLYPNNDSVHVQLFQSCESQQKMKEVIQLKKPLLATDLNCYYSPIQGKSYILGVIGVYLSLEDSLDSNEITLIKSISTQVAFALERELLYEQHKQANLEAEKERLRGNLLRSISNDLRTPLTSILGSSSTLLQNDSFIDEQIKNELLQNIYDETSWLTHSIENILSMTKIDEGRLDLNKQLEIVDELITESMARIQRFHHECEIIVDSPDELIFIHADAMLIETVLVNLLDNAIRFSTEDHTIIMKIIKEQASVVFQIIDQGPGLSSTDIPLIFNRFYTKTKTNFLERRGIGLGLAICKSIVEAHGGTIKAFNNVTKGCTFEFTIPTQEENNGD